MNNALIAACSRRKCSNRPVFDLTLGVLPAGLTLTRASTATVQTGTSAVTTGVAVGVARFGRLLDAHTTALLFECSRTNLCMSSEDPTSADWVAGVTVITTRPDGTAPNGSTTTATKHAVTSPGYSRYRTTAATTGVKHAYSQWSQSVSGTITARWQIGFSTSTYSATTAWGRVAGVHTTTGIQHYLTPAITDTQTVRTWGHQIEVGQFASSYIPTGLGATATRSGERLVATGTLTSSGRLTWYATLRPLGASTEYVTDGSTVTLWYVDASNKAQFDTTTLVLTITIGGATNTCTLPAWSAGDTFRISIQSGGSVATVVKHKINGAAATSLAITGSALGALATTTMDCLCNGTTQQWSGFAEALGFTVPSWAA